MMNHPKHWKSYLNYLNKLEAQHETMLVVKELEIRSAWEDKTFSEQLIDRIFFRPSVPDSIFFKKEMEKIDKINRPDTNPSLEGYWSWLVERKDKNAKLSDKEVMKAISSVVKWSSEYMKAARKGDTKKMEQMNKDFDAEKIVKEARKK